MLAQSYSEGGTLTKGHIVTNIADVHNDHMDWLHDERICREDWKCHWIWRVVDTNKYTNVRNDHVDYLSAPWAKLPERLKKCPLIWRVVDKNKHTNVRNDHVDCLSARRAKLQERLKDFWSEELLTKTNIQTFVTITWIICLHHERSSRDDWKISDLMSCWQKQIYKRS